MMKIKDLNFDVALVAGPRIGFWPSPSVPIVSEICARYGLKVGWIGAPDLKARGVLPLPGTGGVIFCEDSQGRILRVQSRAIVRWIPKDEMPNPFEGSHGAGLIPGATALRLADKQVIDFGTSVAILGTDNRAFRFGSELLERGAHEVFLIEPNANWEGKRYAGWEVEKRRFEILGGKLIEAEPMSLRSMRPLLWEFRVKDPRGVRLLEVNRVVSFGPFESRPIFQEYPPGSLLYRFEQIALPTIARDSSGWMREEEAAQALATRIVRGLVSEIREGKDNLDFLARRSRLRLGKMERYRLSPHSFQFQGKWLAQSSLRAVREFSGVPSVMRVDQDLASIECFETIGCTICARACPENAIVFDRLRTRKTEDQRPILNVDACTGCGICTVACPSSTPILIREREDQSLSVVGFGLREPEVFKVSEVATTLNRRGEVLGTARVISLLDQEVNGRKRHIVRLEVPTHLVWEIRGIRKVTGSAQSIDLDYLAYEKKILGEEKTLELTLDSGRRFVRERLTVQEALFQSNLNRAGDQLQCPDGSCGLCELEIDGVRQLSCRTTVRKGMVIRTEQKTFAPRSLARESEPLLCPCMNVSRLELETRIREGRIQSPETALQSTGVGQGRCHGQLCLEPAKRCMAEAGIDLKGYTSWKFPWVDWQIDPSSVE